MLNICLMPKMNSINNFMYALKKVKINKTQLFYNYKVLKVKINKTRYLRIYKIKNKYNSNIYILIKLTKPNIYIT
jgi:hypothetical protein